MDIFLRILSYVKPFWKHLVISIVSVFLFALMNGLSIYLTIPLLGALFQEETTKETSQAASTSSTSSLIPEWVSNTVDDISQSMCGCRDKLFLACHIDYPAHCDPSEPCLKSAAYCVLLQQKK